MVAVLFREALVLSLSVISWFQCRSFSVLAQILHPTGAGFLAPTTDFWAISVQILDAGLHGSRPSAGLMEDIARGSKSLAELVQGIAVGVRPSAGLFGSLVYGQISCTLLHLALWKNILQ